MDCLTLYLPIRAFGDFVITAAVVKGQFREKIPVLLPDYLNEIFHAIDADQYFEIIGEVPFSNQPIFFQLFTLTESKNRSQLIRDIAIIRRTVNRRDTYLLDYSSKRLFFTGARFLWPGKHENNYEGKLALFSRFYEREPSPQTRLIKMPKLDKNSRVIILPDSRVAVKRIDTWLVTQIRNHFSNTMIDVASFSMSIPADARKSYQNFQQLIALINDYDLIIGAESLPYHLANYLEKPHFVIYNQSRHMKKTFMTPFMVEHKAYIMAKKNHPKPILRQLETLFY